MAGSGKLSSTIMNAFTCDHLRLLRTTGRGHGHWRAEPEGVIGAVRLGSFALHIIYNTQSGPVGLLSES